MRLSMHITPGLMIPVVVEPGVSCLQGTNALNAEGFLREEPGRGTCMAMFKNSSLLPRMQKRQRITRAAVMLLVSALVWALSGSAASARTAQSSKDTAFVRATKGAVTAGIESLAGTRFEVNAFGTNAVEAIFADGETMETMVARVKNTCVALNGAAKKGPKAARAKATAVGRDLGQKAWAFLKDIEADPDYSAEDKYAMGVVIGLLDATLIKMGTQTYCPRHGKHVPRMTRAWNNAVLTGS